MRDCRSFYLKGALLEWHNKDKCMEKNHEDLEFPNFNGDEVKMQ